LIRYFNPSLYFSTDKTLQGITMADTEKRYIADIITKYIIKSTLGYNNGTNFIHVNIVLHDSLIELTSFRIEKSFITLFCDFVRRFHSKFEQFRHTTSPAGDELANVLLWHIQLEYYLLKYLQTRFPEFPLESGQHTKEFRNSLDTFKNIDIQGNEFTNSILAGLEDVAAIRPKYARQPFRTLTVADIPGINSYFMQNAFMYKEFNLSTPFLKYATFCTACCALLYVETARLFRKTYLDLRWLNGAQRELFCMHLDESED